MKINVGSFGYFGYFLAKEMSNLNQLGNLFTNLPPYKTKEILSKKYHYNPTSSFPYIFNRMGMSKLSELSLWPSINLFDKWMASNMTDCDIFHCFSSFGLAAHKSARENFGAITVVERGSTHICFQNEILKNEYEKWGVAYKGIDSRVIKKEIQEYDYCNNIIVQSEFAKKTFTDLGIADSKLIVLPLGVNLDLFRPEQKYDDIFRVLAVGTLSLRKGSLYLLQALRGINLPNLEFVFNGKISTEIRELILPYSDIIRNVGTRPFNELYKLYSQASVFVLPTIEDGFGNVIIEAMACGIPVIATTNCGASEVIEDGVDGFIVPIRDPKAIREKIVFLYENPIIRESMGRAALEKARATLSVDSHGLRALRQFKLLKNALSRTL